jgi:hypothetical protein
VGWVGPFLNDHPCVVVGENALQKPGEVLRPGPRSIAHEPRGSTNAATEALQLSILNASVIASGSSRCGAAHV